ncbi:MAG: MarR family transcriptional regulator [Alphaproteobacteria bacterium]|nr:MarR family transcriptional regulator [Alphaproteobacteria bacterium]
MNKPKKITSENISDSSDNISDDILVTTRQSLPISLLRTRELIMSDIRPILQKYDLTEQQWRFLRVVTETENADASFIAHKACLHAPSVTRILRNLIERGYVQSHVSANDKRRVIIKPTAKAHKIITAVLRETNLAFEQLRQIIGAKRWKNLVDLLIEVRDEINNHHQKK